jgi:hypothetical protein
MDNDYYVYTHCDINGNVFYIGKGKGYRAFNKNRSEKWLEKINAIKEYVVEIPYDNLTEEEAFDCEALLIQLYKKNKLVNILYPKPKSNNTVYYDLMQKAKDVKVLYDVLNNFDEHNKNNKFKALINLIAFTDKMQLQVNKIKYKYGI